MEAIICLLILIALAAFGIRYRVQLLKWLNTPYNPQERKEDRIVSLKRELEDVQAELDRLTKEE